MARGRDVAVEAHGLVALGDGGGKGFGMDIEGNVFDRLRRGGWGFHGIPGVLLAAPF